MLSNKEKMTLANTLKDILEDGKMELIDERFARDYTGHTLTELRGLDGARGFAKMMRSAFSDINITIEDEISEGNKIVQRWTVEGRHDGEFQGIEPTGNEFTTTGISIYRIENGKIAEEWTAADMLRLMQQLEAIPELETVS